MGRFVLAASVLFLLVAPNVGVWYGSAASYGIQRWLQVALLTAVGLAFVSIPAVRAAVVPTLYQLPRRSLWVLVGVGGLGVISSFATVRPPHALRELALFVLLFLLTAAVATARRYLKDSFDRTMAGAVATMALFYVTAFLAVLHVEDAGVAASSSFVSFVNPRFFGQFQSWTLPLIVLPLAAWPPSRLLPRMALWIAASSWWMLFFLCGTRGSMLGLAVSLLVVLAVFGGRALPWLRLQSVALLGGAAAYVLFPGVESSSALGAAVRKGTSDGGRLPLWQHAFDLLQTSPWLGIGPAHYAHFRPSPEVMPAESAHPHSAFIQWATEWGLPSAIAVSALVAWGLRSWLRIQRRSGRGGSDRDEHALPAAVTASLVTATVHSFFSGIIVMPLSQTVGALVIGWAIGIHLSGQQPPSFGRIYGQPLLAMAFFAAVLVLVSTTFSLPEPEWRMGGILAPRFWVHGPIP